MVNHLYQQQKYWHWCTGMSLLLQLRMGSAKKSNLICVSRSFMLHFVSGEHWGLKLCKINTLTRFKGLKAEMVTWLHCPTPQWSRMRFLHVQHHLVRFQQMCCSEETAQIYHSIRDVLYRDVTLRNMDAGEQNCAAHKTSETHLRGKNTDAVSGWSEEEEVSQCL